MRKCPNCGTQVADGVSICNQCGSNVPTHVTCGSCGTVNPAGAQECTVCGAALAAKSARKPVAKKDVMATVKGFGSKIAAAVPQNLGEKIKKVPRKIWLIGGAAVAVLILLIIVLSSGGGLDYDYALYINEDAQLSYVKLNGKGDPVEVTEEEARRAYMSQMASDGKTLFYLDFENGEGVLYYRNVSKPKADPVELESNVSVFSINEKGSRVYYLKGDKLYVHDLKDDEKIDSNVSSFYLAEDGKRILYITNSGELCLWNGKDSKELDSDVSYMAACSDDLKTIYYYKEGDLYLKKGSKDGQKVLSNCYNAYLDKSAKGYALKEAGDYYDLYYIDGYDAEKVASDISTRYVSDDRPAALYYVPDDEQWCVAVGAKTFELDLEDVSTARIAPDGKTAYFVTDVDDRHGDLYSVKIGSKPGDPELVDEDVYRNNFGENVDNVLYYFKDVESGVGTLFLKNKEIAEDVLLSSLTYNKDKKTTLFVTEWEEGEYVGVLNAYKSKVQTVAEDVYHNSSDYNDRNFFIMPNGEVLYFTDYDWEDNEGVLNCFNGSKSVELADDATCYVPIYAPAE